MRPGGRSGDAPGRGPDVVAAAMRAVDRRAFLPRAQRRWAGQDRPLAIGHGQTNSQPSTVAAMLRLLDVAPGARVLDVGSGSGWTTALLAVLVGPSGSVLGVERDPELAAWGAANLTTVRAPWARIVRASRGALGTPGERYDRILVSAAADALPQALVGQLASAGRMVVPVRHTMLLVEHDPDDPRGIRVGEHGSYSFVPLVEDPPETPGTPGTRGTPAG
ncbi:protein-L-isoaspartate O-methyltransferase family protein [Cellulosimicrobium protaetiae]|uniref:Protein-L-isoaspartate O-methyltransferase n=1 Tax=Cellulosimicrobium protaetiae TaxID=2587808 RepID=A0A6M5UGE6_9MICO|nr:protein-L-isoaspartate O-methyltransferase [Cellulosimicrobium protaetiae]QJW36355.1 protein-L-isoaspartate O-methyltransferase [Cellulosimicrobium protaetiae]